MLSRVDSSMCLLLNTSPIQKKICTAEQESRARSNVGGKTLIRRVMGGFGLKKCFLHSTVVGLTLLYALRCMQILGCGR